MGYAEYIQKAIDFIEEHIKQPITIEECASAAGFSKYHFYRLFGMYVGMPVMDYVRRRRLEYSRLDICEGKRVLDVALDYDYGSERSFSRAFRQEFGRSPGKFKGTAYSISVKPALREWNQNLKGGLFMESIFSDIRFVDFEPMVVASARMVSSNPEDEVIAFMTRWAGKNGIGTDARRFGFDIPVSEEDRKKGFRGYEYWVCVNEDAKADRDITVKKVDGCKYAVLRITDPFSDPFAKIPTGWKQLVEWVNAKGYKAPCDKERYWLEEVVESNGVTYMDIYFPVN